MKLYASSVAWALATTVWLDSTTTTSADNTRRKVSREGRHQEEDHRDLIFSYLVNHDIQPLNAAGVKGVSLEGRAAVDIPEGTVYQKKTAKQTDPKEAKASKSVPAGEGRRDLFFSYLVNHDIEPLGAPGVKGLSLEGRVEELPESSNVQTLGTSYLKKKGNAKKMKSKSADDVKTSKSEDGLEVRRRKLIFSPLVNHDLAPGVRGRADFAANSEPMLGKVFLRGTEGSDGSKGGSKGGSNGGGRMNGRMNGNTKGGKGTKGNGGGAGGQNAPDKKINTGQCSDICGQPGGPPLQCDVNSALQWQDLSAASCCCSDGASTLKLQLSDVYYFRSNSLGGLFSLESGAESVEPSDSPSAVATAVEVTATSARRGNLKGRGARHLQDSDSPATTLRIIACDDICLRNPLSGDRCSTAVDFKNMTLGSTVCFAQVDVEGFPRFDEPLPSTITFSFEANDEERYFNDINTSCENPLVFPWASMALASSEQTEPVPNPINSLVMQEINLPIFVYQGGISVGSYRAAMNDRSNEAGFQLDPASCGCDCEAFSTPTFFPTTFVSCDPTDTPGSNRDSVTPEENNDPDGDVEIDNFVRNDPDGVDPNEERSSDPEDPIDTDPDPIEPEENPLPENPVEIPTPTDPNANPAPNSDTDSNEPSDDMSPPVPVETDGPRTAAPIGPTGAEVRPPTPSPTVIGQPTESPTPRLTVVDNLDEAPLPPNDPANALPPTDSTIAEPPTSEPPTTEHPTTKSPSCDPITDPNDHFGTDSDRDVDPDTSVGPPDRMPDTDIGNDINVGIDEDVGTDPVDPIDDPGTSIDVNVVDQIPLPDDIPDDVPDTGNDTTEAVVDPIPLPEDIPDIGTDITPDTGSENVVDPIPLPEDIPDIGTDITPDTGSENVVDPIPLPEDIPDSGTDTTPDTESANVVDPIPLPDDIPDTDTDITPEVGVETPIVLITPDPDPVDHVIDPESDITIILPDPDAPDPVDHIIDPGTSTTTPVTDLIPLPEEISNTDTDNDSVVSTGAPIATFPPQSSDTDTGDDTSTSGILPVTSAPTAIPTKAPSKTPTSVPTDSPTTAPTSSPSSAPTDPQSTAASGYPTCEDTTEMAQEANTCGFDGIPKSIYDYLCSVNNFSNFCLMIQRAGLRDLFSGVDGETQFMTLFAPTNSGCKGIGLTIENINSMDEDLLKHIVLTHATNGKVRAENLMCDGELPTLKGTFSVHTTKCYTAEHARAQYGFFNVEGQMPMILSPNNLELCNGLIQPVNNMIRVINY